MEKKRAAKGVKFCGTKGRAGRGRVDAVEKNAVVGSFLVDFSGRAGGTPGMAGLCEPRVTGSEKAAVTPVRRGMSATGRGREQDGPRGEKKE